MKEGIDTTIGAAAHIGEKAQEYGSVAADKTKEVNCIACLQTPSLLGTYMCLWSTSPSVYVCWSLASTRDLKHMLRGCSKRDS